jgi:hypothetical protein
VRTRSFGTLKIYINLSKQEKQRAYFKHCNRIQILDCFKVVQDCDRRICTKNVIFVSLDLPTLMLEIKENYFLYI